jgi:hypothetical protein
MSEHPKPYLQNAAMHSLLCIVSLLAEIARTSSEPLKYQQSDAIPSVAATDTFPQPHEQAKGVTQYEEQYAAFHQCIHQEMRTMKLNITSESRADLETESQASSMAWTLSHSEGDVIFLELHVEALAAHS